MKPQPTDPAAGRAIVALTVALTLAPASCWACPSNLTPVRIPVPVSLAGQNVQERHICAARTISVAAEKMRVSQGFVCRPDERPVEANDGSLWYGGCAKEGGPKR